LTRIVSWCGPTGCLSISQVIDLFLYLVSLFVLLALILLIKQYASSHSHFTLYRFLHVFLIKSGNILYSTFTNDFSLALSLFFALQLYKVLDVNCVSYVLFLAFHPSDLQIISEWKCLKIYWYDVGRGDFAWRLADCNQLSSYVCKKEAQGKEYISCIHHRCILYYLSTHYFFISLFFRIILIFERRVCTYRENVFLVKYSRRKTSADEKVSLKHKHKSFQCCIYIGAQGFNIYSFYSILSIYY